MANFLQIETTFYIYSFIYPTNGDLILGFDTLSFGSVMLFGVGLVTAIAVTLSIMVEHKWLGTRLTFEWFYTGGRSAKTNFRPKIYMMHVLEWSDVEDESVDETLPTR